MSAEYTGVILRVVSGCTRIILVDRLIESVLFWCYNSFDGLYVKLTKSEIDARMEAYGQAASSLDGHWFDTSEEQAAGRIVARQIRSVAEIWYCARMGNQDGNKEL